MKKHFFLFLVFLGIFFSEAQTKSGKWSDLFSYNNVLAMEESNGKIIAATENGVFYYDTVSGEITKLSKANGLHEVKISAFDYNPVTKIGLVGYKSGNLDVISPDGVTYIVDIPLSQTYTGSKKINHISINGDKAVVSVGYGVSIFNLSKKEFGDTCFFNNGTLYEASKEAVIKDNVVYALTSSGIKYHALDVTFSVYSNWSVYSGAYSQIDADANLVIANQNNVYYGSVSGFTPITQAFTNIKDIKVTNQNIIVTDFSKVYIYSLAGVEQKTVDLNEESNCAVIINSKIYTGTKFSGIYDENKVSYKPDGPYSNISYKISLLNDKIWISTGSREGRFNFPPNPYVDFGFYYFNGSKWFYPSYFTNNPINFNILDAVPNPNDYNEVFLTNYSNQIGQGIYKMKFNDSSQDFDLLKYYNTSTASVYLDRPVGLEYDENNNLFVTIAFSNPDGTVSYGVYDKTTDQFITKSFKQGQAPQKPILKDGFLWAPFPRGAALGAVDLNNTPMQLGDDKFYFVNVQNGFPGVVDTFLSAALDKNGDMWIGSNAGLRILPSAVTNVVNNKEVSPVIITQNGLAEELFKDLGILQIAVDSGNQKWVSIEGGGVYYLSSNGETTFNHFTKVNSPLPNDIVTDIKVDEKTGKVYFVTYEGIVVYQGDVSSVSENFNNVKVYPNPVITSQFKGNVKITGLAEKTNIRIVDAAGNLIHQAIARGGYYEWNLNNYKGEKVASGIYFVLMTNDDGTDKATAKIAIVN